MLQGCVTFEVFWLGSFFNLRYDFESIALYNPHFQNEWTEAEMTSRTRALSLVLLLLGLVHTVSPFAAQTKRKSSPRQAPKQEAPVPDPPHDPKQQVMELLPLAIGAH